MRAISILGGRGRQRGALILGLIIAALFQPGPIAAQRTDKDSTKAAEELEREVKRRLDMIDNHRDDAHHALHGLIDLKLPPSRGVPLFAGLVERFALKENRSLHFQLALSGLTSYGKDAKSAVPMLVRLCEDPKADYAESIAVALFQIDPDHPRMVELLMPHLRGNSADHQVVDALGSMGSRARAALPALEKTLKDRPMERDILQVYVARGKILDLPLPTMDQIREQPGLDLGGPDEGYAVLASIQKNGRKAPFAVQYLCEALEQDLPPCVRCMILQTLGTMELVDPRMVPVLFDHWAKDELYRQPAAVALWRQVSSEQRTPELARAIADGINHPFDSVKLHAIHLLQRKPSGRALPAIILQLEAARVNERTNVTVFTGLLMLLQQLGEEAQPAADALYNLLLPDALLLKNMDLPNRGLLDKDANFHGVERSFRGKEPRKLDSETAMRRSRDWLRSAILVTLADIGGSDRDPWPMVERLAHADDPLGQAASMRLIGALGTRANRSLAWLLYTLEPNFVDTELRLFGDPPHQFYRASPPPTSIRLEAIKALGEMGASAREALPLLKELLAAEDKRNAGKRLDPEAPPIAREARRAIRRIERDLVRTPP